MKLPLLAGAVAACALALLTPAPAAAQLQVICPTCASELGQVSRWAQQASQMVQQLNQAVQRYQQLQATFASITGARDVTSVASALNSLRSVLPPSGTVPGIANGGTVAAGTSGFLQTNRVYTPTGTDFEAQEMQRRQQAYANLQAMALTGMQRAEERRDSFQEFVAAAGTQPDTQASASLQNRIQLEQAMLANEQEELTHIRVMAQMQASVDAEREQEAGRQASEAWAAKTAGAWSTN